MRRVGGLLLALSLFVACEGDSFAPAPSGAAGATAAGGATAGRGGATASGGDAGRGGAGASGASAGDGGNVQAGGGQGPDPGGAGGDGQAGDGQAGDGPGGATAAGNGGVGGGGEAGDGGEAGNVGMAGTGAGVAGMAGSAPAGGKSGAAGTTGTGGAGGVTTTCKEGTTQPCTLHACATAGEKKCTNGVFGACNEREDKTCGGAVDVDCNGVPGDAQSCSKLVYMHCKGGEKGPGCNGLNDCFISGSPNEGATFGYTPLTSFRVFTKDTKGALPVRRCVQDGTNIHRTAIGTECSAPFMFEQEGSVVGYLMAPTATPPAKGYRKIYGGGDTPPTTGSYWLMTDDVCGKTCNCTIAGNDHLVVAWAPP